MRTTPIVLLTLFLVLPSASAGGGLQGYVEWEPPVIPVKISVDTSGQVQISPRSGIAIPLGPFGKLELGLGYSFEKQYKILTVKVNGQAKRYAIEGRALHVTVDRISSARIDTDDSGNVTVDLTAARQFNLQDDRQQELYFPDFGQNGCSAGRLRFRACINDPAALSTGFNSCLYSLASSCDYWQPIASDELKIKLAQMCANLQRYDNNCRYIYYNFGPYSAQWQEVAMNCMNIDALMGACRQNL